MANKQFVNTKNNVVPNDGAAMHSVWVCDTYAGRPVTNLQAGDLGWMQDQGMLYVAVDATTWRTTPTLGSLNNWTVLQSFFGGIYVEGGFQVDSAIVSSSTTIAVTDNTIYATVGAVGITITLPATSAATIGVIFYIFKADSGVGLLTVAPSGTNTLNGINAAKTVANQWNGCRVQGLSATGWLVTSFTGL